MSDSINNHDDFKLLEETLRGQVEPTEPLKAELTDRIVAAVRIAAYQRRRSIGIRRLAIGAAAIAAGVLLAIGLLLTGNSDPIDTPGGRSDPALISGIPPAPAIVDDSLAAVEEFAAGSVVQEMRDLARDASDIGGVFLASLPGQVVDSRLWSGFGRD